MAILWLTVAVGMARTGLGFDDDRPISYLGTDGRSSGLFRAGLLVATALLVAFGLRLARGIDRPRPFLAVFLVGMAGQAVVAVVTIAGSGPAHAVHTTAGIILGLSLPVFIGCYALAQPPGRWRTANVGLTWLEVAACAGGVALSRAHLATVAEIVPAAGFHLWVFVVTFHPGRGQDGRPPKRPPVPSGGT